ncbi:cupin domain-containing protein [Parasphingopyxis lamellibrachiae]|uniref:DUF985 domain-containing protein n=1 Tax=Parasphingopyxis lamellibrachiae TaxID=680125 RepID=A0A3D9FGR6_9SPHN|nr:cupin domain-containing protein [Parasphingopyxis lamellibrachiae]RED16828.1 hypothetical protein DFR46_1860 [Parasphingopyxis lamellibrachiae]
MNEAPMNDRARQICDTLALHPHPEGGWYKETWRAEAGDGERAGGTAIHFLLAAGERSHWHKVDAAEIWLWHGGDPLALSLAETDTGPERTILMGGDIGAGQAPQAVVPTGHWQAAEPASDAAGYVLVSCIVVPGFEFAGFTLAPEGWTPAKP